MKEHHPQSLVDPGNGLGIQAQITSQSISRLLLIKALQDGNLATQLREAFLLAAEHAFNIATRGFNRLKRTTKNTLATIQKVGRTTKNRMGPNNHKYLQGYIGYETP
jgi:N-acetylglutamate synthase-like GNAT family acetyltransferase